MRELMMNGEAPFNEIIFTLIPDCDEAFKSHCRKFINNLWYNFLTERSTALDRYILDLDNTNQERFNAFLCILIKLNWIISEYTNNFVLVTFNEAKVLEFITRDELHTLRASKKCNKYTLKKVTKSSSNKTKLAGKIRNSGLDRPGFAIICQYPFKYAVRYIIEFYDEIAGNITKGMSTSQKDVSYQTTVHNTLHEYETHPNNEYTVNESINDSRGRVIFQCTSKIFNPVSHKDARACMIIPKRDVTDDGINDIYAFISELLGYRGINREDKVKHGMECYTNKVLPEPKGDSLHEYIWLHRIYTHIDEQGFKNWDIPIEIDAMASILQWVGVLTNDHTLLRMTNVLYDGEKFCDAWTLPDSPNGDVIPRDHVKKALTAPLYGSSASVRNLWIHYKKDFSASMVNYVEKQKREGIYASAMKLKDFIITQVHTAPIMTVKIWNEVFDIMCNKYIPDTNNKRITYFAYTNKGMRKVSKATSTIADLKRFKTYFMTLLIHNLDSQVSNYICENMSDFILPNHDAWNIHPNDCSKVRELYINIMYQIYKDRHMILDDYFKSIGIEGHYADVDSLELTFETFNGYCLK